VRIRYDGKGLLPERRSREASFFDFDGQRCPGASRESFLRFIICCIAYFETLRMERAKSTCLEASGPGVGKLRGEMQGTSSGGKGHG